MIKSVTVTNPKNETLVLDLFNPWESGLGIKSIEGLGPAKAFINTTDLATIDGTLFSGARITERNIVLTLIMFEKPTIEDSRLRTYKYFPIKKWIKLRIKTDNRDAEILGYVESNEPNIFDQQETTQISILCPDPFFYEFGSEETIFSGVMPMFEFPFSNESLTENLIEFGDIRVDTSATLNYIGDADTGITITIHAMGPARKIVLYNSQTYERMPIDTDKIEKLTGKPFDLGDDIIINTIRGNRYVRLLRDGVYTNAISIVDKNSDWFQLSNGDNIFTFTAEEGENNLMIFFLYRNAYGGI